LNATQTNSHKGSVFTLTSKASIFQL